MCEIIFLFIFAPTMVPPKNLERQRSKQVPSKVLEGIVLQADALGISMKEHMGRSVE
jgi:hypothetical protein